MVGKRKKKLTNNVEVLKKKKKRRKERVCVGLRRERNPSQLGVKRGEVEGDK